MTATDISAVLSRVDLFAGLPAKVIGQIVERGHEATYDAGVPVVVQGESVSGFKAFSPSGVEMHVILDGQARVDVNGVTHTVLGPGQYFGEVALIDGKPRTADVVPENGGLRTFAISKWTFEDLLDNHPEVAIPMLRVMASRLRAQEAGSQ
jgi:CRP-like cAMP-binding protein